MNASLSGMPRFYLALVAAILFPSAAFAQSSASQGPPAPVERPPLGTSLTVDAFESLPSTSTVFALFDTTVPDVVSERLDTGVLSVGQPTRLGAHGSTWTQTMYRLGDADITDPSGSGAPLLIPGIVEWNKVDVATGIMPTVANAPGTSIPLVPRRASSAWSNWLNLAVSPSGLNSGPPEHDPPAIARMNNSGSANLVLAGPVSDELGAFVSGTYLRSSIFERTSLKPWTRAWAPDT